MRPRCFIPALLLALTPGVPTASSSYPKINVKPSKATREKLAGLGILRGPVGMHPLGLHISVLQAMRLKEQNPEVDVVVDDDVASEAAAAAAPACVSWAHDITDDVKIANDNRTECATRVQKWCEALYTTKAAQGSAKTGTSIATSAVSSATDEESTVSDVTASTLEAPFVPFDELSLTTVVANFVSQYYFRGQHLAEKEVQVFHQSCLRYKDNVKEVAKADIVVGRFGSVPAKGLCPVAMFEFGLWSGKCGGWEAKFAELLVQMVHAARHKDGDTRPKFMIGFMVFLNQDKTVKTHAVLMQSMSTSSSKQARWARLWVRDSPLGDFARDFVLMLESADMALYNKGSRPRPELHGRVAIWTETATVVKTLDPAPRNVALEAYVEKWKAADYEDTPVGLEGARVVLRVVARTQAHGQLPGRQQRGRTGRAPENDQSLAVVRYKMVTGTHEASRVGDFRWVVLTLLAMHKAGVVHGDIRGHNIVFAGDDTRVIDFDYVGEDKEDVYTSDLRKSLPDLGPRPEGAKQNAPMHKWHDWQCLAQIMDFHVAKTSQVRSGARSAVTENESWTAVKEAMAAVVEAAKSSAEKEEGLRKGAALLKAIDAAASLELKCNYNYEGQDVRKHTHSAEKQ